MGLMPVGLMPERVRFLPVMRKTGSRGEGSAWAQLGQPQSGFPRPSRQDGFAALPQGRGSEAALLPALSGVEGRSELALSLSKGEASISKSAATSDLAVAPGAERGNTSRPVRSSGKITATPPKGKARRKLTFSEAGE